MSTAYSDPAPIYRKVEITKYEGSGVICDPYWYVCGTYPVNSVIGSRGGWDPGFNIGGGVGIHISETAEFFIESRFHYVVGPDINDASATAQAIVPANGTSTDGLLLAADVRVPLLTARAPRPRTTSRLHAWPRIVSAPFGRIRLRAGFCRKGLVRRRQRSSARRGRRRSATTSPHVVIATLSA